MADSAAEKPLQFVLVSRELYPFGGGGMGNYVAWTAQALAEAGEVTLVTTERHEEEYRRLRAAGDPRIAPGVRYAFAPDFVAPDFTYVDLRTFYGYFHRWSASVFETICEAYPGGGPDLIEFPEYHGEGAVTIQARRTGDPRLRNTLVCVRINSSSELVLTLDGSLDDDFQRRAMFELERYSLRYADRVIWPGGDVLATYERFYGADAIAPAERIRHAVSTLDDSPPKPPPRARAGGGPLRLLYMGRLERRKGIHNLVRALLSLEREDWSLTVLGADTGTGPLGLSMRGRLELTLSGDPRVRFIDAVPRERVLELIDEHDLCVVPSLWECWPNVALEAYLRGRPVLGTPAGGLVEIVRHGRTGFLADGADPDSLTTALERILDGRDDPAALGAEELRGAFAELTDGKEIRGRYVELATESRESERSAVAGNGHRVEGRRGRTALAPPKVSIVVTYHRLADYVSETIESLVAQTHSPIELIVVNDGSFEPEDAILERLAERHPLVLLTQPNSGLSAARNFGISQASGEYVMPFDADDVAEPTLVERCVAAFAEDPSLAYVTTWSRFVDEEGAPLESGHGYEPIGNWSGLLAEQNVAGGCVALMPRELFDAGLRFDPELTSYEDWDLYRQLAAKGRYGQVIPERLYRYRVRRGSMVRVHGVPELRRHRNELAARERERSIEWTRSSA